VIPIVILMINYPQCEKLAGETAFEQLVRIAPDKRNFLAEVNNYMQAGVLINTPRMFVMVKPVDSSEHPDAQWWVENPDAWYVRWASSKGAMNTMMTLVEPLPYVVFRRVKEGVTKPFKRYDWNTLFRRIGTA
jgi:hypothetical protein